MSYKPSTCPECLETYKPRRWDQIFCRKACTLKARNREASRGALILAMAIRWRADRKNGQAYLRGLCRVIARFIEEDRKAGRSLPKMTADQRAACDWTPGRKLVPMDAAKEALEGLGIWLASY